MVSHLHEDSQLSANALYKAVKIVHKATHAVKPDYRSSLISHDAPCPTLSSNYTGILFNL